MNQSVATNSSNNEKLHYITAADLPLSCPNKGSATWNLHPLVYLDISDSDPVQCPYCSTSYVLKPQ